MGRSVNKEICQHIIICPSQDHRVLLLPSAQAPALVPMSQDDEFASVYKSDRPLRGDDEAVRLSNAIDEDLKASVIWL